VFVVFTKRQIEIARLKIRDGLSNREIAKELGISETAVRQHLCRLREKIRTMHDSLELLTEIELITPSRYKLTEKGRAIIRETRLKIRGRTKSEYKRKVSDETLN